MRNEKETVLDLLVNPRAGDNFDRKQTEKELLEAITSKNEQLAILHQVNSRLAFELSQLQRRLGIDPHTLLRELQRVGDAPVPSSGRLEYLEPLLVAYDETILKQKKIIAMLYSQLEDFERRSETLVRENECLLEESKNKCKKILEIYHRGSPEESLTLAYNRLLRETDQERNDLIRQQSEEVLQGYHRLELHAQALERELQQSRSEGEEHFALLKRQGDELKQALLSVDNLLKVKEFLEKTVSRMGEENIALQTLKAEQQAKLGKQESELKALRSQLLTQKKLAREDTERIGIELDSLKAESQQASKRERELFNRNMLLEKEVESIRQALRTAKREGERDKAGLQQTMRMCETYESKVAALGRKERSLVELLDQTKEKLDSLLLERDKALLKVDRLEKALEESAGRQREEQVRIRQNYEKMLTELHERVRLAQEEREDGEAVFMETQLTLKNQLEKLTRENSLLREENLKFIESIHVNSGSEIIGKLKEYEGKHDSLLKLLGQKERQLKEQLARHEEQQHDNEAELKNLTRLLEKEKSASTQYLKQIAQERSRANILANEKDCLEAEVKRLKKSIEFRNVQASDDKEQRLQELEARLTEALRREKETKLRACQMLQKYDAAEQVYRGEYEKQIVELQAENEKLRRKLEKLKAKGSNE